MKKFTFITVMALAFSTFCVNAFAAEITMKPDANVRNFEITAPVDTNEVMVKVYNAQKGADNVNGFLFFKAVEVDKADGKFKFSVVIPEVLDGASSTGDYIVKCVWNSNEIIEDYKFSYLTATDAVNFYSELRTLTASEIFENMKSNSDFSSNANAVGVNLNLYNSAYLTDEDKNGIAGMFADFDHEDAADSELIKIFNKCINLKYLTVCSESERVKVASGLDFTYDSLTFNALLPEKQVVIADFLANQNYTQLSDGNIQFGKAVAISEINSARKNKLTEIFNNYKSVIEIEENAKFKAYLSANETKQLKVNDKFINSISKADGIKTVDEIVEYFESAYDEVFDSDDSNKSSGGGGSRSSGSVKQGTFVYEEPTAQEVNAAKIDFSDIENVKWAVDEIKYCVQSGIITGYSDGTFRPDNMITREEFVALLIRATNVFEEGHKSDFEDVEKNSWYEKYVACAKKLGIVNGISEKEFGIGLNITREDMAVIVANALNVTKKNVSLKRDYVDFSDQSDISDYAVEAVKELYSFEIINGMGDGCFAGKEPVTRAQAAKVIYNAFCR